MPKKQEEKTDSPMKENPISSQGALITKFRQKQPLVDSNIVAPRTSSRHTGPSRALADYKLGGGGKYKIFTQSLLTGRKVKLPTPIPASFHIQIPTDVKLGGKDKSHPREGRYNSFSQAKFSAEKCTEGGPGIEKKYGILTGLTPFVFSSAEKEEISEYEFEKKSQHQTLNELNASLNLAQQEVLPHIEACFIDGKGHLNRLMERYPNVLHTLNESHKLNYEETVEDMIKLWQLLEKLIAAGYYHDDIALDNIVYYDREKDGKNNRVFRLIDQGPFRLKSFRQVEGQQYRESIFHTELDNKKFNEAKLKNTKKKSNQKQVSVEGADEVKQFFGYDQINYPQMICEEKNGALSIRAATDEEMKAYAAAPNDPILETTLRENFFGLLLNKFPKVWREAAIQLNLPIPANTASLRGPWEKLMGVEGFNQYQASHPLSDRGIVPVMPEPVQKLGFRR